MSADAAARAGLLGPDEIRRFVRPGHFAYESGAHGDCWLELELLFTHPPRLQQAGARLAERLRPHRVDFVCGPLAGGAFVAQAVAAALGAEFVFAEARPAAPGGPARYAIPRALHAACAGRRAAIVDDAINAGWAVGACAREIAALGGTVEAIGSLIVREPAIGELSGTLGRPVEALLAIPWSLWAVSACPLCRAGVPLGEGWD